MRLYLWHFFPTHIDEKEDGYWKLKFNKNEDLTCFDKEGMEYAYPPPRNIPMDFMKEVFPWFVSPDDRWAQTSEGGHKKMMPEWMWEMLIIDGQNKNRQFEEEADRVKKENDELLRLNEELIVKLKRSRSAVESLLAEKDQYL
mmetsp:Transcript_21597/g.40710  ORF Transcript_21597/g.40710 Transcript_21597/m.40710 type:complete len:143 (+) Transcript_21597:925-1353(+)